ncbi:HAMP domain-containing methyl-accepting chemotaxis protein [Neorhizobium sp. NCHU2750]|uniref:methyl-accepting chemotaxis protein n=1 Tax=Neorhizobium sp. NCHU2750 TaxID=1825976 RepID=UPI000E732A8E|nr:methyl-accepting chemotaxis protein [Neorhizobium sp. NCHU2750]
MQHIKIAWKILSILAVFGLFSIAAALYAGKSMIGADDQITRLMNGEIRASVTLLKANLELQNARADIADLVMVSEPEAVGRAFKDYNATRKEFEALMDSVIAATPGDAEMTAIKQSAIDVLDKACKETRDDGLMSTTKADRLEAIDAFSKQCQPNFPPLAAKIIGKSKELEDAAAAGGMELHASLWQTASTSVAAMVGGTVLIMALAWIAVRFWLVRPVNRLSGIMATLASGEYEVEISGTTRRDEIGAMANAVQVFKDNAHRARETEREAAEHRDIAARQRDAHAEEDRIRAAAMARATEGLAGGLRQLAAGDLTARLDAPFAADFETLRSDFNAAVVQLQQALGAVARATRSIDSGSREVSQSADDLAKRTEQQAASLEETAAALDEITTNVANSTRRAEEARSAAVEANKSARLSGQVVQNTVEAMARIEQSSGQISSIIGVIDEIAFQTNLLALNAGVEAARAGDAGKGFAVVAQEVRELAQRSAAAAREIKGLIGKSSVEVSSGVKLVSETGTALKAIEAHIVSINGHMDAIATSSREQSTGLSEVNGAVNRMDQVTQQNAAMVEEANAAGATLAAEAGRLQDLIGRFRIEVAEMEDDQAEHLRRTAEAMAAPSSATPSLRRSA